MDENEQPPHQEADHDAPDRHADEFQARLPQRERSSEHRRHRELVDHQSRGVVHEALALEHGDHVAGDVEPRKNGGRRRYVGRRDDRPEHESRGPGDVGNEELESRADRERGCDHQTDGEQPDRADVRLELVPGREQGRLVENRRQYEHEQELRVELKLRQPRHEAERPAPDHERDRVGKLEVPRHPSQRHCAHHQEQDHLQQGHGRLPSGAAIKSCRTVAHHAKSMRSPDAEV